MTPNKKIMALFVVGFVLCFNQVSAEEISNTSKIIEFKEVFELARANNTLIIDVREPHKIFEVGKISNSINMPLGVLVPDLTMPESYFINNYGIPKPKKDDPIVVYSTTGKRSTAACKQLEDLGYTQVKNYLGGFVDWIGHRRGGIGQ